MNSRNIGGLNLPAVAFESLGSSVSKLSIAMITKKGGSLFPGVHHLEGNLTKYNVPSPNVHMKLFHSINERVSDAFLHLAGTPGVSKMDCRSNNFAAQSMLNAEPSSIHLQTRLLTPERCDPLSSGSVSMVVPEPRPLPCLDSALSIRRKPAK